MRRWPWPGISSKRWPMRAVSEPLSIPRAERPSRSARIALASSWRSCCVGSGNAQGLTLAEAAERLGQRSKNAYARYEQGKTMPTVEKLEQLLTAIAPDQKIVWHFAA